MAQRAVEVVAGRADHVRRAATAEREVAPDEAETDAAPRVVDVQVHQDDGLPGPERHPAADTGGVRLRADQSTQEARDRPRGPPPCACRYRFREATAARSGDRMRARTDQSPSAPGPPWRAARRRLTRPSPGQAQKFSSSAVRSMPLREASTSGISVVHGPHGHQSVRACERASDATHRPLRPAGVVLNARSHVLLCTRRPMRSLPIVGFAAARSQGLDIPDRPNPGILYGAGLRHSTGWTRSETRCIERRGPCTWP